jgi:hypothetical protein
MLRRASCRRNTSAPGGISYEYARAPALRSTVRSARSSAAVGRSSGAIVAAPSCTTRGSIAARYTSATASSIDTLTADEQARGARGSSTAPARGEAT